VIRACGSGAQELSRHLGLLYGTHVQLQERRSRLMIAAGYSEQQQPSAGNAPSAGGTGASANAITAAFGIGVGGGSGGGSPVESVMPETPEMAPLAPAAASDMPSLQLGGASSPTEVCAPASCVSHCTRYDECWCVGQGGLCG
jgi:hypothetical protein